MQKINFFILFVLIIGSCRNSDSNDSFLEELQIEKSDDNLYFKDSVLSNRLRTYVKLRKDGELRDRDLYILMGLASQYEKWGDYMKNEMLIGHLNPDYWNDNLRSFFLEPLKEELINKKNYEGYWLKINNWYEGIRTSLSVERENNIFTLSLKKYVIPNLDSIKRNLKQGDSFDYEGALQKVIEKKLSLSSEDWALLETIIIETDFWNIKKYEYDFCADDPCFIVEGFRSSTTNDSMKMYNLLGKYDPFENNGLWKISEVLFKLAGEEMEYNSSVTF